MTVLAALTALHNELVHMLQRLADLQAQAN